MKIPVYPRDCAPGFVAASLDRRAHLRNDEAFHTEQIDQARLILLHQYRMPVRGHELETCAAREYAEHLGQAIWLGHWNDQSLYALDLGVIGLEPPQHLRFQDLRGAALRLDADHAAIMAYARAMVFWQQRHRFCGRCGHATEPRQAGHVLWCRSCELEHYPRSDPSMLVQVSDAQDRCLLGRQAGWPAGMWSVLAGFVEPGESIEDAVVREVWEEARVKVTAMQYSASQPWPFPASILLGFHALGEGTPEIEQDELEAADWFSREQIQQGLNSRTLLLPPPFTLSWHLIEAWFNRDGGNLKSLI